jgi:uncharacterized membrane protein
MVGEPEGEAARGEGRATTALTRLASQERNARRLARLQILTDVVYAVMLVRIVLVLPRPQESEGASILEFFRGQSANFEMIAVGTVLLLVYWTQSNLLFNNLARSDGRHSVLSILQLVFLLLYVYFVRLGMDYEADPWALVLQSSALAACGIAAAGSWYHAVRADLVEEDVSAADTLRIARGTLVEPLTALFALPFAFLGPTLWTLAFLAMVPLRRWLVPRPPKAA